MLVHHHKSSDWEKEVKLTVINLLERKLRIVRQCCLSFLGKQKSLGFLRWTTAQCLPLIIHDVESEGKYTVLVRASYQLQAGPSTSPGCFW